MNNRVFPCRALTLGLVLAAVVTGAFIAPALAPYAALRNQDGFRSSLNIEEANAYSADGRAFLRGHSRIKAAMPFGWPDAFDRYVGGNGEVLFPGFVILVLAVAGALFARPRPSVGT